MCSEGTRVSAQTHRLGRPLKPVVEAVDDGRVGEKCNSWLFQGAFKRPAPAVWGNGLWGSVGWSRAIL
jgi:hypothetical protein